MLDVPESISQMVDRTNRAELIADVIASDEAMGEFRESGTTLFNLTNGDN